MGLVEFIGIKQGSKQQLTTDVFQWTWPAATESACFVSKLHLQ